MLYRAVQTGFIYMVKSHFVFAHRFTLHPLGYERVYLPLCNVADTPFHIQGDDFVEKTHEVVS